MPALQDVQDTNAPTRGANDTKMKGGTLKLT